MRFRVICQVFVTVTGFCGGLSLTAMLAILQSGLAADRRPVGSASNDDRETKVSGLSAPVLGDVSHGTEVERGKVCHERQAGTSPRNADHDR
jgi:hypothetical protein